MRDGLFGWALDLPSKAHRQPQFRRGRNWGESSLELIGWRGKGRDLGGREKEAGIALGRRA